jgi:hypothetical protein
MRPSFPLIRLRPFRAASQFAPNQSLAANRWTLAEQYRQTKLPFASKTCFVLLTPG